MNCPNCGVEVEQTVADSKGACPSCGKPLEQTAPLSGPRRLSRLALASFLLGLWPVCLMTGGLSLYRSCPIFYSQLLAIAPLSFIAALVLSLVARYEIRRDPGAYGTGLATAGIGLVALPVLLFFVFVVLKPRDPPHGRGVCVSNLMQIGLAIRMYSSDYDGNFPCDSMVPADRRTVSALSLLIPEYAEDYRSFRCPSDKDYGKRGSTAASVYGSLYNLVDDHCSYAHAYGCNEKTADETVLAVDRSWGSVTATVNSPWTWNGKRYVVIGEMKGVNHGSDGVNVLRRGGDAKWVPASRIRAEVPNLGYDTDGNGMIDVVGQLYNP